jgi:hypothetical protein
VAAPPSPTDPTAIRLLRPLVPFAGLALIFLEAGLWLPVDAWVLAVGVAMLAPIIGDAAIALLRALHGNGGR